MTCDLAINLVTADIEHDETDRSVFQVAGDQ